MMSVFEFLAYGFAFALLVISLLALVNEDYNDLFMLTGVKFSGLAFLFMIISAINKLRTKQTNSEGEVEVKEENKIDLIQQSVPNCENEKASGGCCKEPEQISEGSEGSEGCCKDLPTDDSCCKSKESELGCVDNIEDMDAGCCKTKGQKVRDARVTILYSSQIGTAQRFANRLHKKLLTYGNLIELSLVHLADYDPESLSVCDKEKDLVVFILPTYSEGKPNDDAAALCSWIEDLYLDFRVQRVVLKNLNFAIFGLGSSEYGEEYFNKVAIDVLEKLSALSATPVMPLICGDHNTAASKNGSIEKDFDAFIIEFEYSLRLFAINDDMLVESSDEEPEDEKDDDVVDVEDLGGLMGGLQDAKKERAGFKKRKAKVTKRKDGAKIELQMETGEEAEEYIDDYDENNPSGAGTELKEMITPQLRKDLTKQGYRLIGTHSGVKLCRWTKAMLRGRGGCYKHTFYGIASHRCMEMTPNLACANKCVFCWRHHSNPVGTEWRWKMESPELIVREAVEKHREMVNVTKGIPGVQKERFLEGMNPRHVALSLVGEPIMYPKINTFLEYLHEREMSSFMVTNAQFPDAIENLVPVTQLYVSVDAATESSLKAIDRPLFRDFWPRMLDSLDALGRKGQRTVYRMTLVNGWNVEEMDNYATLIHRARPDFIEVKGVTFCGVSKGSKLTMKNVPWHEEICGFVKQLTSRLDGYEIACEHEHSNCLLIAKTEFKIDGIWNTWIDYDKFHSLWNNWKATGEKFTAKDYIAPTPDWCLFESPEQGFDPAETRFRRNPKSAKKDIGGC